jgi:hypothetical protein
MNPPMRKSAAITLLIVAAAIWIGWVDRVKLSELRAERQRLVAESAELGIRPAGPDDDAFRITKRARVDKLAEARHLADDIIALARDLEWLKESGGQPDIAIQDRILDALERFRALDADQLMVMIAGFQAAVGIGDDMRGTILSFATAELAGQNPQAALALLCGSGNPIVSGPTRMSQILKSISNWAASDPAAALAWLRANPPEFIDTESMERAVVEGTARSDLKRALALIGELGIREPGETLRKIAGNLRDSGERTQFLHLAKEFAAADPGRYGGEEMMGVLRSLAAGVANDGYAQGSRWIAENNLTDREIAAMAGSIGHFARSDEKGRWIEWMAENVSGENRDGMIEGIVRNWTQGDHRAAGEWLAAAPDGPAKNASVAAFAKTVAPHNPQIAAQWALTLPPGDKRNETLKAVYKQWPLVDPESRAERDAFMTAHPVD